MQGAYLLNEDKLLVGCLRDDVYVWMVAVHDLAAREARIAGIDRRDAWVGSARTEQGLGEAVCKEPFTDARRASKEIGMTDLLRGNSAAQDADGTFVADDIPAWRLNLLGRHGKYTSRNQEEWQAYALLFVG